MGQNADESGSVLLHGQSGLLVRRPLLQDEWWDWYVVRVLFANGLRAKDAYLHRIMARDVEAAVGRNVARHHQVEHVGDGRRSRIGQCTLPEWCVRGPAAVVSYCPACLSELGYLQLRSRLKGETCCVRHGLRLMSSCHACARRVMVWDLARARCACGAVLGKEAPRTAAHSLEVGLQRAIGLEGTWGLATVANQSGQVALAEQGLPARELVALSVFARELLNALSTFRTDKSGTPQRAIWEFAHDFAIAPRLELEWVEELWSALEIKGHLDRALMLVLKLHQSEQLGPTVLSKLPLWDWARRLLECGADLRRAELRGLVPKGALRQPLLTVEQAARRAGLRYDYLHELVRTGKVKPTKVIGRGQRIALFSDGDAELLTAYRPIGYQYGQALPTGIQLRRMKHLGAAGLTSMKTDQRGRSWLDGAELRALLAGLAERALPLQEGHGPVANLASMWVWQRRHVPAFGALFGKLLNGELLLWSSGDAPGFDRYFVGIDFLSELAWRSRVVSTRFGESSGQAELGLGDGLPVLNFAGALTARLHPLRGPMAPRKSAVQMVLPL